MNKSASQVCAERIAMLEGALAESNTALALKFQEVKTLKDDNGKLTKTVDQMTTYGERLMSLRERDADTIAKLVKAL